MSEPLSFDAKFVSGKPISIFWTGSLSLPPERLDGNDRKPPPFDFANDPAGRGGDLYPPTYGGRLVPASAAVSLFPGGIRFQKFESGRFDSGQFQLPASEVDSLIALLKEEAWRLRCLPVDRFGSRAAFAATLAAHPVDLRDRKECGSAASRRLGPTRDAEGLVRYERVSDAMSANEELWQKRQLAI